MKKNIVLSFLSGLFLIIPFVNGYNLWFFAWIGFVPLFLALENQSKIKSFLLAYLAGVVFWLGTIYWLIHITFLGMMLLVLYLGLYFGIFGLISSYVNPPIIPPLKKRGRGGFFPNLFFIPSIWVVLEYIRGYLFTGFPWTLLGYSQYRNLPVIQIADITGVWGVSFLVMLANIVVYQVLKSSITNKARIFLLLALIMSGVLGYGYYKIHRLRLAVDDSRLRISLIQVNIPQELKWDVRAEDFITDAYLGLTKEAINSGRPDLIIWPESSLPVVLGEETEIFGRVREFVRDNNIGLLLGLVRLGNDNYYNSAVLISKQGEVLDVYDKIHLVPFGEYVPLKEIFPFLEAVVPVGDFSFGREYTVFDLPISGRRPRIAFSVLVCFEDVFPQLSRNFVLRGSDFLVNITNDAWFKKTSEPYQHLQASVFRAVENRLWLMRSANTGVSAFICPSGEIFSKVEDGAGSDIFVRGAATQEISVPAKKTVTFYTRSGDVFVLLCISGIMICLWVRYGLRRR